MSGSLVYIFLQARDERKLRCPFAKKIQNSLLRKPGAKTKKCHSMQLFYAKITTVIFKIALIVNFFV
jgi:hypothetical protein